MAVRLHGDTQLLASLARYSRILRGKTQTEIRRVNNTIKKGSQRRAPEKSGALVASHRVVENTLGRYRSDYLVTVGPVYDDEGEDYTIPMHEGVVTKESAGARIKYQLGEISQEKNQGPEHAGVGVGWKFLERAFRAETRAYLRNIRAIMRDSIAKVTR